MTKLNLSTHCDRDHVISQEDFDDLNDRVRHYMDWSTNNMNYQTLKEVRQSSANPVVEPAQSAEDWLIAVALHEINSILILSAI